MIRAASLVGLVVAMSLPLRAQAQTCASSPGRTVTVNGSATLRLLPDRVTFSVGVETESLNVAEAFKHNTEKVNSVIAVLKEHGVKPQEIQTSNFGISSRDELGKKTERYRVTNSVTVTRKDLSSIGELLQAAVEKGANEAGSLQFVVSDQKEPELRGLGLAFQNAHVKAERLAALSGKTLGEVVCVSEQGFYPVYGSVAEAITVTAEAAPSIETGVQQLSFRVGVVFELR